MLFEFDGSVCSDICRIKDFIEDVLKKLNEIIKDESIMFEVKLILNELIVNGAIHGNQYDKDKFVSLLIEVFEDFIKIEVKDEGKGFECNLNCYNPLDLKCSGRGLIIVNGLSDEFYVEENKVVAVKYL